MSYLVPRLRKRVQIQTPTQTPNNSGGFDRSYVTQDTIWGEITERSNISDFVSAIRGENATIGDRTHKFTFRRIAVAALGRTFSAAFDTNFDNMADLAQLKSDWFLFLEEGSSVKGRRFRIKNIKRDDVYKEFVSVEVEEIEEIGTGYPS